MKRRKIDKGNSSSSDSSNNVKIDVAIEQESELLNILDNDCLREIFKYLTLLDLINAAEVCIRFNQHANDAFNENTNIQ